MLGASFVTTAPTPPSTAIIESSLGRGAPAPVQAGGGECGVAGSAMGASAESGPTSVVSF